MNKRLSLAAAAFAALGSAAAPVAAQSCPANGAGNIACITQIGDLNRVEIDQEDASGNRAEVRILDQAGSGSDANSARVVQRGGTGNRAEVVIRGDANGDGDVDSRSTTVSHRPEASGGGPQPAARTYDISMPSDLPSGLVRQVGNDNQASVNIRGNANDFHLSQRGDDNFAEQRIRGNANSVVLTQGEAGARGSRNHAEQAVKGDANFAYSAQRGDGNYASLLQVGEASNRQRGQLTGGALGAFNPATRNRAAASEYSNTIYNELGVGGANEILLEQNGDDNLALLVQAGSANSIGLAQDGGAFARIVQDGSALNIQVNQMAGVGGMTTPITIVQHR